MMHRRWGDVVLTSCARWEMFGWWNRGKQKINILSRAYVLHLLFWQRFENTMFVWSFVWTFYHIFHIFQAIQKGNLEGAKIHAENSIRQKNQALNYRRMSARIDAVSARVQTALTMKQVGCVVILSWWLSVLSERLEQIVLTQIRCCKYHLTRVYTATHPSWKLMLYLLIRSASVCVVHVGTH